jgi:hypothetical protein
MPTKQELAESLTIAQLRELATEQSIDISGLTAKADLVDAIVAGTTAAAIEAKVTSATTPTQEGTTVSENTEGTPPEEPEEKEPLALSEPLGPRELVPTGEQELEPRIGPEQPWGPEEQQEAGVSPADLELGALAAMPSGPKILTKVNPETPSPQQVDAAVGITSGPPVTTVTVSADGEETRSLAPDDAALISQRLVSDGGHPAHASAGHYANPIFREVTDEEREADREAYASRFG